MPINGLHHAAYRCKDAQATVDFYSGLLGLPYVMAISEDRVPSTKEPDPYMHIFFDIGKGGCLAFFELPTKAPMGRDPNTPAWVQHIALACDSTAELDAMQKKLAAAGVDVLGPTDHGIFQSIYFFDPSGNRVELCCNTGTAAEFDRLKAVAGSMLEDWNRSKKTVRHASFVHEKEFAARA
jgi:glyoxylase I family protein